MNLVRRCLHLSSRDPKQPRLVGVAWNKPMNCLGSPRLLIVIPSLARNLTYMSDLVRWLMSLRSLPRQAANEPVPVAVQILTSKGGLSAVCHSEGNEKSPGT
jgi:hypothetical protein